MYYKITFDDGRRPAYGVHRRGSQALAAKTERLAPGATHTNGTLAEARKAAGQEPDAQVYIYTTDIFTTYPKIAAVVKGKNINIP